MESMPPIWFGFGYNPITETMYKMTVASSREEAAQDITEDLKKPEHVDTCYIHILMLGGDDLGDAANAGRLVEWLSEIGLSDPQQRAFDMIQSLMTDLAVALLRNTEGADLLIGPL